MTDKNNDEYEFEDDLYDTQPQTEQEPAQYDMPEEEYEEVNQGWVNFKDKARGYISNNLKFVIVLGVAVVAMIVFDILPDSSPKKEPSPQKVAAVQPSVQEAVVPQVVQPAPNMLPQKVDKSLSSMRSSIAGQAALNSQTNNQVRSAMSLISQNADAVSRVSDQVSALSSAVNKLTVQLKKLTKPKAVKKPSKQKLRYTRFSVQAVQPGRAWLLGSNKRFITVSVGDKLRGYGRVQSIDEQQGAVFFDTGKRIQMAPNRMSN